MRFDVGAVQGGPFPVDEAVLVSMSLQGLKQTVPGAVSRPAHEPVVTGLPGTVATRNVTPIAQRPKPLLAALSGRVGSASFEAPEDAVDDFAVWVVGLTTSRIARKQGFERCPLRFRHVRPVHPKNLPTPHEFRQTDPSAKTATQPSNV